MGRVPVLSTGGPVPKALGTHYPGSLLLGALQTWPSSHPPAASGRASGGADHSPRRPAPPACPHPRAVNPLLWEKRSLGHWKDTLGALPEDRGPRRGALGVSGKGGSRAQRIRLAGPLACGHGHDSDPGTRDFAGSQPGTCNCDQDTLRM